jgi:hypothetical protein
MSTESKDPEGRMPTDAERREQEKLKKLPLFKKVVKEIVQDWTGKKPKK